MKRIKVNSLWREFPPLL